MEETSRIHFFQFQKDLIVSVGISIHGGVKYYLVHDYKIYSCLYLQIFRKTVLIVGKNRWKTEKCSEKKVNIIGDDLAVF